MSGNARREILGGVFALVVPFALYAAIILHRYDGETYLRGDCRYYYAAAVSLYADHDLDIANQLRFLEVDPGDISIAKDGRLVPKHPTVMSVAALPLIAFFGAPGALTFNLLQLAAILLIVYRLALRCASPVFAALAVIATGCASVLPHYVWNFSPDLFAAMLLCAALLMLPDREMAAGFLFALAAVSKFALIFFLPGALLLCRRRWLLLAGAALPFLAFALYNQHFFGSPFATSYDRIVTLEHGRAVVVSQRADFTLPLLEGIARQLDDPVNGLLKTSALTVLSLLALPFLAERHPRLALYLGASSAALFLFYSKYRLWNSSHIGNRFLMPIVILGALPLAAMFESVTRLVRAQRIGAE